MQQGRSSNRRSEDPSVAAIGILKSSSFGVAQANFPAVTARFAVQGGVGSLKVEGDIVEVVGTVSGARMNALEVGGSIFGSSLTLSRSLGSATVAGNIQDTVITSGKTIGSLVVGGSILDSDVRALVSLLPITAEAVILIQGDLVRSRILAGYDSTGPAVNGDATIGTIAIAGNFEASSIAAGAAAGVDMLFGASDDTRIATGFHSRIAKIAAINIKGAVLGSAAGTDAFGIVAEELGKLKIGGVLQALTTGPRNDLVPRFLGGTNDVRAREVA